MSASRLVCFKRLRVHVSQGSLIRAKKFLYSVHSRLIGEEVDVRIHAVHIEVWYAQKCMERLPRLRGVSKHHINYRHVIDWLVRKPGAFENYRYREDLFPTSRFRMTYDNLREEHSSLVASRQYLTILELAARENEAVVDDVLRHLIATGDTVDAMKVKQRLLHKDAVPSATDVTVEEPDLVSFDCLFDDKEVFDGGDEGCEEYLDWSSSRTTPAHVS